MGPKSSIRDWVYRHRLLDETVEQFPAMAQEAAIEAKRELIQVGVQMRMRHRALVNTQELPFQEGSNSMHARQQRRSGLAGRCH